MGCIMKYRKGIVILEISDKFVKRDTYLYSESILSIINKYRIKKIILDTKRLKIIDKYSLNFLKKIVNDNEKIFYSKQSKILKITEG